MTDSRRTRRSSFDDRGASRFDSPIVNGAALLVLGLVAVHLLANPRLASMLAILITAVAGFIAIPYLALRGSMALVTWLEGDRTVATQDRRSDTGAPTRTDD